MVRTLFRAGIFINFDFFFYIKLLVHIASFEFCSEETRILPRKYPIPRNFYFGPWPSTFYFGAASKIISTTMQTSGDTTVKTAVGGVLRRIEV